jgi:exoribonuclease II
MRRTVSQHNAAKDIIESLMVAANVAMARYLKERHSLSIRRVVRRPRRWDRIRVIAAQFGATLPEVPDPRALSEFLDQRQVTDPVHFADLSLSVVRLLGHSAIGLRIGFDSLHPSAIFPVPNLEDKVLWQN